MVDKILSISKSLFARFKTEFCRLYFLISFCRLELIDARTKVSFCSSEKLSTSILERLLLYLFFIISLSKSFKIALVKSTLSMTVSNCFLSQELLQLSIILIDFVKISFTVL